MPARVTASGARVEPLKSTGGDQLDRGAHDDEDHPQARREPDRVGDNLREARGLPGGEVRIRAGQAKSAELRQQQREAVGDQERAGP